MKNTSWLNRFENFKIAKKLSFAMAIIIGLFVISSLITVIQLVRVGSELSDIAHYDIVLTEKYTEITVHQLHQAIYFERALKEAELMQSDRSFQDNYEKSIDNFKAINDQFEEQISWIETFIEDAKRHVGAETLKKFDSVLVSTKSIHQQHKRYAEGVF